MQRLLSLLCIIAFAHHMKSRHYEVYKPEGAVGIRYKKQIFNKRDLGYIGFSSHVLESVFRKKYFLTYFDQAEEESLLSYDDYLVSEVCPSAIFSSDMYHDSHYCSQDMMVFTYLSTNYYKPKNDYIQSPFKNETFLWGGIQIQSADKSGDIDFPRDNFYLNYALGVKNTYEVPMAPIEEVEIEQIIESFLYKKAKTHNRENFIRFAELYGPEKVETNEIFSTFAFTFDDVEFIASLTDGLRPNSIQQLGSSNTLFKFFHSEFEVSPSNRITFEECQVLIPKRYILTIDNLSKSKALMLKDFRTSSPELTPYLSNGKDFPIKLGPLSSLEVQLVFLPETQGLFESVFYISVNDVVFVGSVNAFVISNSFELSPIYITDVNLNSRIVQPVKIFNPLPNTTLVIEELWATDKYAQLYWPNGEIIPQNFDSLGNPEPSKEPITNSDFMKLKPMMESTVFHIIFQVNQTQDYYTEIQIRTNQHDIIRLPVYFHVHSDAVKFLPPVADFGIVPLNFDLMKITVRGRNKVNEPIKINDVFVPIQDSRLDFIIIESKNTERVFIFKPDQEFLLGYVLMASKVPGPILQKVVINATGQVSNKTYKIEYMITGSVNENPHTLQGNSDSIQSGLFKEYAPPMVSFDVGEYIINQQMSKLLFVIPQFRPVILTAPLIIKNTFKVPILIKGIVNNNKEFKVNVIPGLSPDFLYKRLILQPNESVKFAQIEVLTTQLKISQGIKYISIEVNNTQIPAAVQIYDRHLTCVWDEHQKSRFLQCGQGYDMNFGYVPTNEPKRKKLNITNLNPHSIMIENVMKSQLDDLIVYVDKIHDKTGKQIYLNRNFSEDKEGKINLMTQKRTKKIVNLTIQPQQTVSVVFQIISKEARHRNSRIEFQTKKKETADFAFNYQYTIVDGNLSIVPQIIRFNSALSGQILTKPLIARSTFDIPIVIKHMTSSDIRIFPTFSQQNSNIIMPRNKTEIGIVTFDANRINNNIMMQTFENAKFGQQQAFDQQIPQHIVQMINNGQMPTQGQITMIMNNDGQQIQINNQVGKGFMQQGNMPNQKSFITIQDLLMYKEKQKIWDDMGSNSKTEINAALSIETNVFQNISVQVKAHMTKPTIMVDDQIEFDTVQIGSFSMKNIKIVNPSDHPLMISLFLANTPLNTAEEFNEVKPDNITNELWTDQLTEYSLELDNPISQYCNSQENQNISNNKSEDSSHYELNEEIFVDMISDSYQICNQLQLIFNSEDLSISTKDSITRNLEIYFRVLNNDGSDQYSNQQLEKSFKKNFLNLNKNLIKRQSQVQIDLNQMNIDDMMREMNENSPIQQNNHYRISPQINIKELENYAGKINKISFNRYIDMYVLNMIRIYEKTNNQGFFDTLKGYFRQQPSQYKQKLLKNATLAQQQQFQEHLIKQELKKQQRFRLKNNFLNDIIINSDYTRFNQEYLDINNQKPFYLANQSFYINPKIHGTQFKVDAHSNVTIREAIIFQPQSLSQDDLSMQLIVKNNLTYLYQVELVGNSGTGMIEFTQVLKKQPNSDSYVSVPNVNHQLSMSYMNQNPDIQTKETIASFNKQSYNSEFISDMARQRILNYIYGDRDHLFENKTLNMFTLKQQELEKVIYFNIAVEDMILIQDERDAQQSGQGNDYYSILGDLLTDKFENIKLNTYHKRIFIARNIGNLPIQIDFISIEGKGCRAFGIVIENCHQFTLKPGEVHQLHISFTTDYSIGKLRKSIIFESKLFVQEIFIQIQMPMALLPLANEIIPLTPYEETLYLLIKFLILGAGLLCISYISRDIISHFKFKHDQQLQERFQMQLSQEGIFKMNQQIKVKDLPIMKEILGHDQIINTFQTAQEKFENPNQLLLKEISNLCSNKKNLVIIEAQKQAIDAEKERRTQQRIMFQQNIVANKYLESRFKEEQQQIQQQQNQTILGQQLSSSIQQRNDQSSKKHGQNLINQQVEQSKYQQTYLQTFDTDPFTKVQAGRNQGQKQKQQQAPNQQYILDSSKTSNQAEKSIEIKQESNFKPQKNDEVKANQLIFQEEDQKSGSQKLKKIIDTNIESPNDEAAKLDSSLLGDSTELNDQFSQNLDKQQIAAKSHKVSRLSKKQQRATAQRIKEQQELEERFRLAQKRKEEEAILEQKRKEQELSKAKVQAIRAQEELNRLKEEDEARAAATLQYEAIVHTGTDSLNQSLVIDRDNSLNLSVSQVDAKTIKSKSQKEEQEFKQNLDYIGDLNEDSKSLEYEIQKSSEKYAAIKEKDTNKNSIVQKVSSKSLTQQEQEGLDDSHSPRKEQVEFQREKSPPKDYLQPQPYTRKVFIDKTAVTKLSQNSLTSSYRGGRYQNQAVVGNQSSQQTGTGYYGNRYQQSYSFSRGNYQEGIQTRQFRDQGYQKSVSVRGRGRGGYYRTYEYEDEQDRDTNYHYQSAGGTYYQSNYYNRRDRDDTYSSQYQDTRQQKFQKKQAQGSFEEDQNIFSICIQDQRQNREQLNNQNDQQVKSDTQIHIKDDDSKANSSNQSQRQKQLDNQESRDKASIQKEDYDEDSSQSASKDKITLIDQIQESDHSSEESNSKSEQDDDDAIQEEEIKQFKPTHSPRKSGGQLSKDDLKPFFENQKRPTCEFILINTNGKCQNNRNYIKREFNPNNGLGQSIFSFNPLNIFSQPIGATQTSQPTNKDSRDSDKEDDDSQNYQKDLSRLIEDEDEDLSYTLVPQQFQKNESRFKDQFQNYERNSTESFQSQSEQQKPDFYNTFKSASSLFSKPLFGATIQKINDAKQQMMTQNQQPNNQFNTSHSSFQRQQTVTEEAKSQSFVFNTSNNEDSHLNEEEEKEQRQQVDELLDDDDEEENNGSLFSGSLFGDSGPFASSTRIQQQYQPFQQQQKYDQQSKSESVFSAKDYYSQQQIQTNIPFQKIPASQNIQEELFFPPPGLSLPQNAQNQKQKPQPALGTGQNLQQNLFGAGLSPYQQYLQQQQQLLGNVTPYQPQSSQSASLIGSNFNMGFNTQFGQQTIGSSAIPTTTPSSLIQSQIGYPNSQHQLLQQHQQQQYQLQLLQQLQLQQLQQQQLLVQTQVLTPQTQPFTPASLIGSNANQAGAISGIWNQQTSPVNQNGSQQQEPKQSSVDDLE